MKMYATTHRAIKRMAMRLFTAIVYTALAGLPASLPAQETEADIPPALTEELPAAGEYHDPAAAGEGEKQKDEEVVLPGAEIKARRETAEHVSQEQMIERGDTNVFEVLRWMPGVSLHNGHAGTGLGGVKVRGFGGGGGSGNDYLTILQDGTPISDLGGGGGGARPDYAGMLTGGLESIDLTKGYTSVLLGPNIIAGALVLRTAKPKKIFELNANAGFDFDAGGFSGTTDTLTLGSRFGIFYARAGVQEKYVDHWRLPDDYEPCNYLPPEEGGDPQQKGNRLFSSSNALGVNLMAGVNPLDTLDIWATYAYSSRTVPDGWGLPRAGVTTTDYGSGGNAQDLKDYPNDAYVLMWGFPYRNRHDATLHAEWTPDKLKLALHGYFNLYNQREYSLYDPAGVGSWGAARRVWPLYLDGYYRINELTTSTFGVNLEGGYEFNDMHKIGAAIQFRQNNYNGWAGYGKQEIPEHTSEYQTGSYTDNIYFSGVEYTVNPITSFTAIAGFGLDMSDPQKMDRWGSPVDYNNHTRTPLKSNVHNFSIMPQWSLGFFYDLAEQHELHFTYAKKNLFPSFSDKTGAQGTLDPNDSNGYAKPNLDLKPQQIHHFEIGYKGYFLERIRVSMALYTNYELNTIATIQLENDPQGYRTQRQNVNENLYYGLEFNSDMFISDYFGIGGSFSASKYKILNYETANADVYVRGSYPLFTANGYCNIFPFGKKNIGLVENIRIIPRLEYVSMTFDSDFVRYSQRRILDDYVVAHIGVFADIAGHFSVSFSVHNLFDQLYYPTAFMPNPGRSFTISLGAKF